MKKNIVLLLALLTWVCMIPSKLMADVATAALDTPWVVVGMPRVLHLEVTVPDGADVNGQRKFKRMGSRLKILMTKHSSIC